VTKRGGMSNNRSREMGNQRGGVLLSMLVILGVIYMGAFYLGQRGWGYTGYYGYRSGPSFMYWGGPPMYYGPSVRTGSVGGPDHRGGGVRGGK
jgi:hypothetical protein